jgi:hypothetical protein
MRCAPVQNGSAAQHSGGAARRRRETEVRAAKNVVPEERLVAPAQRAMGIRTERGPIHAGSRAPAGFHEQRDVRGLR